MYVVCGDNMKKIVLLVLFVAISAFSKDTRYEWTDENGCSFCLYGVYEDGKCVHIDRKILQKYDFEIDRRLNNNSFRVGYPHQSVLHVYCKNGTDYCKTINDSMVVKLKPSIKERKSYCMEQRKKRQNTGMFYMIPICGDDIKFLCDFIEFDYRKSVLKAKGRGSCPVRVKGPITRAGRTLYAFYNLYITKYKMYEIKEEIIFTQTYDGKYIKKKDFFTLGDCSNSNCEILNYIDKQPQDFDIKCNFIKKKDGQIGKVQVVGEGVCPIEITGKNNEKQVYYVRSVKDGDAYRLLMTNKRK